MSEKKTFFLNGKIQKKNKKDDRLGDMEVDLLSEEEAGEKKGFSMDFFKPRTLEVTPPWIEKLKNHRTRKNVIRLSIVGVILIAALAFFVFDRFHTGSSLFELSAIEQTDVSGTRYLKFGRNLLKYSGDGVSAVNQSGDVLWSVTYDIPQPLADVCGTTAAIVSKNDTQVYVFDEDGQRGSFQTKLPIEKVSVSRQGVVALVLDDGNVTWVNMYDAEGTQISANHTSVNDFGYPLDVALSGDGTRLMISYLCAAQATMSTRIAFYNFGTVGQTETNNLVSSQEISNVIAPEVHYNQDDVAVAFRTDGFSVYKGKEIPEESANVKFEQEILSMFYDDSYLGFVFASDDQEHKYRMCLYNYSGKKVMERYMNQEYQNIKIDGGNIILTNEQQFFVYGTNGHLKFAGEEEKTVLNVATLSGYRRLMLVTQDKLKVVLLK